MLHEVYYRCMGTLRLANVRAMRISNIPITYPPVNILIIANPIPANRHTTMNAVPTSIMNVIGNSLLFARFLPVSEYPFVIDNTIILLEKSTVLDTIINNNARHLFSLGR